MAANDGSGRKLRQSSGQLPVSITGLGPQDDLRDDAHDDSLRRAVRLDVVQEIADEMAHDLNNVLTVIAGSLQLYLLQQGGERAQHRFVSNAIEAALRGASMTGNLLAYASPQVVDVRHLDLVEVVQALVPLLREALGPLSTLELVLPSTPETGPFVVVADRRFIESTLLALASIMAAKSSKSQSSGNLTEHGNARQMTLAFDHLAARDAARKSGALRATGNIIQLAVYCEAPGLMSASVRQAVTPKFGTEPADRPTLDLSAAYASIRQCNGDIGVSDLPQATGHRRDGFAVSILLPAADEV
jgi:signal transduction histidine kinase